MPRTPLVFILKIKKYAKTEINMNHTEQAARIERELLNRGYGGASARFSCVEDVLARYTSNIWRTIGGDCKTWLLVLR